MPSPPPSSRATFWRGGERSAGKGTAQGCVPTYQTRRRIQCPTLPSLAPRAPSPPEMEAPVAFVVFLPVDTPKDRLAKIEAWGSKRFVRFKVSKQERRDLVVAGGFFDPRRAPGSFQSFRSLMITNLKNWKVERPHYERGWLQFVMPKAWQLELTTPEEREAEARTLMAEATTKALRTVQRLMDQRRDNVRRGAEGLQRLVDHRRRAGFDCLGRKVQRRRAAQAQARETRKRAFNSKRYGLPDCGVGYADEELDACQTWQEVKRRRVEHPQPAWKEREDEHIARTAKEREQSARWSFPVGM